MKQLKMLIIWGCLPLTVLNADRVFEYEEVRLPPKRKPQAHAQASPHNPSVHSAPQKALKWTAPEGWQEKAGSGMRLATLTVTNPAEGLSAECSVVTLVGTAGGVEANVSRWIGQLGLALPGDTSMQAFLKLQSHFTTAGKDEGVLVDLTSLQADSGPEEPSMMAAMIMQANRTVFLKLMGPRGFLQSQHEAFLGLCKSVE